LTKEQQSIVKAARKFAKGEFVDHAREFDKEKTFDLGIWEKACELGFVGVFIEEAYGGAGYGFFERCLITEEFWAVEPGVAMAVLSCNFGAELLALFGTEEQKQAVLPRLASGEAILGTAITEPDAGSDPSMAELTAVKEDGHWVLNGSKMFATGGTIAQFMLVFCHRPFAAELTASERTPT
jgi:alkylation response protein AidB-like acyl-CoA dehydrogenase